MRNNLKPRLQRPKNKSEQIKIKVENRENFNKFSNLNISQSFKNEKRGFSFENTQKKQNQFSGSLINQLQMLKTRALMQNQKIQENNNQKINLINIKSLNLKSIPKPGLRKNQRKIINIVTETIEGNRDNELIDLRVKNQIYRENMV